MKEIIKKYSKTFLSVIFVGWISAYLYDALVIPNFFDGFLKILSTIFSSLVDSSVGRAVHSSNFPYIRTVWIFILPYIAVKQFYDFFKNTANKTFLNWTVQIIILLSILGPGLVYSLDILTYTLIVPSVKNHIEILEPYIPEKKYKLMESDYYRMNSYKDYQQLKKEIEDIMHENKLDSSQVSYNPD